MSPAYRPSTRLALFLCLSLVSLLLAGCAGTQAAKIYTIGVIVHTPQLEPALEGFKAQMSELGYQEGKTINYVYSGPTGQEQSAIDNEVKRLLDQKVNLLLTLGTQVTVAAKKATAGTSTPVVFVPLVNPVEEGIVESINRPGGNITGVQNINAALKGMEWLVKIAPATKRIYVPFHPNDRVSVTMTKPMPEAASQLGVELLLGEVNSPEEVLTTIKDLPGDTGIMFIPMPSLESGRVAMGKLALERDLPAGASIVARPGTVDEMVFTYLPDVPRQGAQAARLVDQIIKGANAGELPVETSEYFLNINLKNAQNVGLNITDDVLRAADKVIR